MIDSKLRSKIQPAFDYLSKFLISRNISPDTITLWALFSGLISSILIYNDNPISAIVLLWTSGFLDVIDGSVARLNGKSTKAGAFYDLIFDRIVEISIVVSLSLVHHEYSIFYILFLSAVIFNFSTFLAAGALIDNTGKKSMHYDSGIAERTETFIVFTIIIAVPSLTPIFLGFFNILIILTGIRRFKKISIYMKDMESNDKE
jgi:phosphatidylglycerophosphate synthase